MKILQAFLLLFAVPVFAQQHLCAEAKQHSIQTVYNKAASINQQQLMDEYDVVFHQLDVNVERDTTYVFGNVRTKAKVVATQLDTFGFELHSAFTVDSVVLSGIICRLITKKQPTLRISVALKFKADTDLKHELRVKRDDLRVVVQKTLSTKSLDDIIVDSLRNDVKQGMNALIEHGVILDIEFKEFTIQDR